MSGSPLGSTKPERCTLLTTMAFHKWERMKQAVKVCASAKVCVRGGGCGRGGVEQFKHDCTRLQRLLPELFQVPLE